MKITRENYESYFIDLLDGTLPIDVVDELLDFMRENPDLAEELKGLEKIQLEPVKNINFKNNSLLKSDYDQPDIFEDTCIRSIENELSDLEESKFQNYLIVNKKAANEYNLFKATISEPDSLIAFSKKDSLKRNRKILAYWYAYAAVLLIGFLLWFNFDNTQTVVDVAAVAAVSPISETPHVELEMQYYKPTLAKLIEVKTQKEPENFKTKIELVPREIENIALIVSLPVVASIQIQFSENLEIIPSKNSNQKIYPKVGEYLANEINKIDTKEKTSKLAHNALDKIKDASNDKLNYAINSDGKVKKIEFNSRLLAFSFPVNSK